MMPIPSSDDITIMLPDFQIDHVLLVINQFNFGITNKSILNSDLLYAMKCPYYPTSREMLLDNQRNKGDDKVSNVIQNESDKEDIHEDSSVSNKESEDEEINIKSSDDEYEEFSDEDNKEFSDIDIDECYTIDFNSSEGIERKDIRPLNYLFSDESEFPGRFDKGTDEAASKVYQVDIQELAHKVLNDDNDDSVLDIKNETFTGAKKAKMRKKEMYRNALEAIVNGECSNIFNAAIKYGVNKRTLGILLRSGRNFRGPGKTCDIFSKAEERLIAARIRQNLKEGNISRKFVVNILSKEFEVLKRDKPERNLPRSLSRCFIKGFFLQK